MKKISSGKVREIYETDDGNLLMFTTDRISAFDVILSVVVPKKGIVLNKISAFWFDYTKNICKNHVIRSDESAENYPQLLEHFDAEQLCDRLLLARRLKMLPFECIVRGYISGSAWNEYKKTGGFPGCSLGSGLVESSKLEEPLFTPSTKAEGGLHDINVTFDYMADKLGTELAEKLRSKSIEIYSKCAKYALDRGIIIADTKFEFGLDEDGEIVLADEVCTPDSSRFWALGDYEPGRGQKSFDKQFMRDWLKANCTDGSYGNLRIDEGIISKTFEKYLEAYRLIVPEEQWVQSLGRDFAH